MAVSLASCDASGDPPPDDAFSLDATVKSASGAPASGLTVALDYGATFGPAKASAQPGAAAFELSAPFPNPSAGAAVLMFYAATDAGPSAQITVDDLDGRRVRSITLDGLTAGSAHSVLLRDADDGAPLAGGLYRVRATYGGETVERWMLRSDAFYEGGAFGFRRVLGTTGADGTLRTTDRTVAPALYDATPSVVVTDETGNQLGEMRLTRQGTVVVSDGARTATREVTLRDGANRVEVVW